MVRPFLALAALVFVSSGAAQDLGRTDRAWREYLYQTVRRGVPVLSTPTMTQPYWPRLNQFVEEARVLEPSADVTLLSAWIRLQEGVPADAAALLKTGWPKPALSRWPARAWGEALFTAWTPGSREWTDAWLAWQDKVYSPRTLIRGIEVFENADPSAVEPLLKQAALLYPEDRRFLPLIARHPAAVTNAQGLVARDLVSGGGWSRAALRELLDRSPASRTLLADAGYPATRLDAALDDDYGRWLTTDATAPADGTWRWDADLDGNLKDRLTFEGGQLTSWTRTGESVWTLTFREGKPDTLTESRRGSSWTLRYEAYPWAASLEYRWSGNVSVYKFPPLKQSVPLWPAERFTAPMSRLPSVLADMWIPLNPQALTRAASSVEQWEGNLRVSRLFLYQGEVWMEIEDSDRDGVDDTWSYYKAGKLASVYHDPEGQGTATFREIYDKGVLTQVQSKGAGAHVDFVLFPRDGVQLWDPHAEGRPLDRVFVWQGDRLNAMVFSGQALPWATMPVWEARP